MFSFFKKGEQSSGKTVLESLAIAKARRYLEELHHSYDILGEIEPFHYVETSEKGGFKRYHFYQGYDKRLIYVVLSAREQKKIIKMFKEKMGANAGAYAYQDTILMGENDFEHRFYRPQSHSTSITFMTDAGEIWGGSFAMDEDIAD